MSLDTCGHSTYNKKAFQEKGGYDHETFCGYLAAHFFPAVALRHRHHWEKEARAFADFLHAAGQSWWQILPVGPTGAGDSPYTSVSTFAGNPLFLDLEELAESGVLLPQELTQARLPQEDRVDYAALRQTRETLLRRAFSRLDGAQVQAVRDFTQRNPWAKEYALYQALRTHFGGACLV